MLRRELIAYALIGLGVLALLGRLTGGAGWLWIALVSVALLTAYAKARTYGLLVVGGLLGGTAAGLLLQQLFPRFDGVFLIALGVGLVAIDRIEPREPRWPRFVGLALAAVGVVIGLAATGVFGSAWFAVLLIALGALVLWRSGQAQVFPPPLVSPPGERQRPPAAERPDAAPPGAPTAPTDGEANDAAASGAGEVGPTEGEATETPPDAR